LDLASNFFVCTSSIFWLERVIIGLNRPFAISLGSLPDGFPVKKKP
jgi:hypothetical protein